MVSYLSHQPAGSLGAPPWGWLEGMVLGLLRSSQHGEGNVRGDRKSWLTIPDGHGECPRRTSNKVGCTLRTGRTVLVRRDPVLSPEGPGDSDREQTGKALQERGKQES